jgi:hypothetical protein
VGVQKARWDKGSIKTPQNDSCFYGKENDNSHLGTGFITHQGIISVIKKVKFVTDRVIL